MEWISVNDRLPNADTLVLVYAPDFGVIGKKLIGQFFPEEGNFKSSWTVYDFNESVLGSYVTHWMPLPKDPKQ